MTMTLLELAGRIGATVDGDGSIRVTGCAPIDRATAGQITFLANRKYARHLDTTTAAAVLVSPETRCPPTVNRLIADDPYFAFRNAMVVLHDFRTHPEAMDGDADCAGISARAAIHPGAVIGRGCIIHPHVTVERGAVVGAGCVLYPGAYVGCDASIGSECLLYPNAVVYDRCRLGDRVTLHANCVVGQDGFGYATHDGAHHKIPQAGIAVIDDDVEIGAGCAIERATMGETRIGRGSKLADLISIGHGSTVGEHCLVVSLVGIAGSAEIGDHVALGGQVAVSGHLRVGDRVRAMARTGIVTDIPDDMTIGGAPAVPYAQAQRNHVAFKSLHEMLQRLQRVERELQRMKAELGQAHPAG